MQGEEQKQFRYWWYRREGGRWQELGREGAEGEWTLVSEWPDDDLRAAGVDPDRVICGISWDPNTDPRPVELRPAEEVRRG